MSEYRGHRWQYDGVAPFWRTSVGATAIVVGCHFAVIGGFSIRASGDLVAVTNAIAIGVVDAGPVAVEAGIGVSAGSIVVGGLGVVVAGQVILASGDLVAVANAVAIGVVDAGPVAVEAGIGVGAGSIVVGGLSALKLQAMSSVASGDLVAVANAVAIGVVDAGPVAVEAGIGVGAGSIVVGGRRR